MNINKIAKKYNIPITQVKRNDKWCKKNGLDNYINRSWALGYKEILLGIYEDKELKLISLFHEIGHVKDSKRRRHKTRYSLEKYAWELGLKLAKKDFNITFSNESESGVDIWYLSSR